MERFVKLVERLGMFGLVGFTAREFFLLVKYVAVPLLVVYMLASVVFPWAERQLESSRRYRLELERIQRPAELKKLTEANKELTAEVGRLETLIGEQKRELVQVQAREKDLKAQLAKRNGDVKRLTVALADTEARLEKAVILREGRPTRTQQAKNACEAARGLLKRLSKCVQEAGYDACKAIGIDPEATQRAIAVNCYGG